MLMDRACFRSRSSRCSRNNLRLGAPLLRIRRKHSSNLRGREFWSPSFVSLAPSYEVILQQCGPHLVSLDVCTFTVLSHIWWLGQWWPARMGVRTEGRAIPPRHLESIGMMPFQFRTLWMKCTPSSKRLCVLPTNGRNGVTTWMEARVLMGLLTSQGFITAMAVHRIRRNCLFDMFGK